MRVQKDSEALVVETVTDAGEVIVRFFGGARLALRASPERARMLRRLIPGSDAETMAITATDELDARRLQDQQPPRR